MTTTPTDRQIEYAVSLQNRLHTQSNNPWIWDSGEIFQFFQPELDPEMTAQIREARESGDQDKFRRLRRERREQRNNATREAMTHHRARQSELASMDLSDLDREELSDWIDTAKQHLLF